VNVMKRRQHQQMVESDHAPYPYQRSQPQHEVSSVRLSLIIGIVILGMLLIAVVILGILSLFDVIHGHPGATWNAWVGAWNAVKWWLLAGVIAVVALNTLKEHSRTAVERAEAKRIREEARQTREETRRMRDLRWHNEDYMPPVYIAHPDEIGNYGQMIDADGRLTGYLFPGNAQTGNAGINPKHLMDFMERQQRVVDADEYEEEDAPLQIEAPKKILLSEQIERGLTMPDEEESVFGYPIDTYEPMRVVLFEREGNFVNSLFVVGQQNQGKSTIGTYFAALTVFHRGYLLVIDPDAEISEQSLSSRLGPLKQYLLCEIAETPEKAKRLLEIAEDEIDHPSDFPLLLLVDEFSLIMRHGKAGGKWQEVAAMTASVVENYATRGRKRLRRAIVFGQVSNASRTGGTELRDSCAQIVFQTPYKKAMLVLQDADDDEIAELAPSLTPGMAIVLQKSDTYIMQFTFPDERGLRIIAEVRAESEEWDRRVGSGQEADLEIQDEGAFPRLRIVRPDVGTESGAVTEHGEGAPERSAFPERDVRPDGTPAQGTHSTRILSRQDGQESLPNQENAENESAYENGMRQPLDGTHTAHPERTADYPRLDSIQVEIFVTAYELTGNIDESLRRAGVNTRYREHARVIIRERGLRRA